MCMRVLLIIIIVINAIIKQKDRKILKHIWKLCMMVFVIAVPNVTIKKRKDKLLDNMRSLYMKVLLKK